ncbi:TetR/AcrR family transcriptional regulator [Solirubrobacter soli]|uniref:TetR/AcrR family transcriptional regulator n=1 Tax=Solirubrobacter soli TaxID=363832 RepID=UPI0003FAAC35|nr:TetR/AcrR family transcriptional regulator [Solirubrobacter soli]
MATTDTAADLWADVEPGNARRLLLAALDAFAQKGYFATTTREISVEAGLSPAAVYVHYPSKNEMLAEICRRGHAEILSDLESALEQPGTPSERVRRFVAVFARFHAQRRTLGRVIQYELRGLTPEQFKEVAATRQRFEELIQHELRAGVVAGEFVVDDIVATGVAILSLCIDVARWHGAMSDRLTPDALGAFYADLAWKMVRA